MKEESPQAQTLDGIFMTPESVCAAVKMQKNNPDWESLPLRLYLEGKGCDGFFYGVTFAQQKPEDLVFQQQSEDFKVQVVVDPETFEFVKGSTIQWVDDERGQGFLVENPKHRNFRGKFYLRSYWKKKLAPKTQDSE